VREFRILMVCTGNICRSPMAEQILAAALLKSLTESFGADRAKTLFAQVSIASAGVAAENGAAMTREAASESARFGGDGSMHFAHRLTAADVQGADLILGMARDHRSAIVALDPKSARIAFTLTEFVRLVTAPGMLDGLEPFDGTDLASFLRGLVTTIARSRGYVPPQAAKELDIADPYGQSGRSYARVGSVIGAATTTLALTFVNVIKDSAVVTVMRDT
jgi:protein-tyrosine phosphatase